VSAVPGPEQLWNAVDSYFTEALGVEDPLLGAALRSSQEAGLPPINVSPNQGRMLMLLAQMCASRRILEVGTLGGYSTIFLARALPEGGSLVSLELDAHHAEVATANIERAGLSDRVEVRVGPAIESLDRMQADREDPFDFVFIDADKPSNADYFQAAMAMSHPGTVIVVDNVVRNGAVGDMSSTDPAVEGVRRLNRLLAAETRVIATAIQTVGIKGYDGFLLARVNG
jgi:predicted O-methyltransferase YrrM